MGLPAISMSEMTKTTGSDSTRDVSARSQAYVSADAVYSSVTVSCNEPGRHSLWRVDPVHGSGAPARCSLGALGVSYSTSRVAGACSRNGHAPRQCSGGTRVGTYTSLDRPDLTCGKCILLPEEAPLGREPRRVVGDAEEAADKRLPRVRREELGEVRRREERASTRHAAVEGFEGRFLPAGAHVDNLRTRESGRRA